MLPSDLEKPTLTFIHRSGLVLTAGFVPSPYISLAGSYKGLIRAISTTQPDRDPPGFGPEDGTASSNSTEGLFNLTLMSTGAFSGNLTIDGSVFNIAGLFDHLLNARFGSTRASRFFVPRTNKPSLVVEFGIDVTGITGSLTAVDFRGIATAVSRITANGAFYNGVSQVVPPQFLGPGGSNGVFTVVFASMGVSSQPDGFEERFYPQGDGIGTITVSKAGIVTLTNCTLADGTTGVTASTFFTSSAACPLFIPLYSRRGFLSSSVIFNAADAGSDLSDGGTGTLWSRPFINTHYYPEGWPEVIKVSLLGAKYTITSGQSVFKDRDGGDADALGDNLDPPDADGNVTLKFADGQLSGLLTKTANVATNDVVTKVPINDPTFTMSIARATGFITGTFRHSDGTVPSFKAIIFQKGLDAGAYGFFLTKPPVPIDYTGESGGVTILGN